MQVEPTLLGEKEFTRSPLQVLPSPVFTDCMVTLEKTSMDLVGLNLNIGKEIQHSKEEQNLFLI